jgi:hypothetical protein
MIRNYSNRERVTNSIPAVYLDTYYQNLSIFTDLLDIVTLEEISVDMMRLLAI